MTVDRHGTPAASQASATGLTTSGVEVGEHQIDLSRVDQRLGELAGARRIGLRVLIEDLDFVGLVADGEAGGQGLARDLEHIAVGLAEAAKRASARADEADFQRIFGAGGEDARRAARQREAGRARAGKQRAARQTRARSKVRPIGRGHRFLPVVAAPLANGRRCRAFALLIAFNYTL